MSQHLRDTPKPRSRRSWGTDSRRTEARPRPRRPTPGAGGRCAGSADVPAGSRASLHSLEEHQGLFYRGRHDAPFTDHPGKARERRAEGAQRRAVAGDRTGEEQCAAERGRHRAAQPAEPECVAQTVDPPRRGVTRLARARGARSCSPRSSHQPSAVRSVASSSSSPPSHSRSLNPPAASNASVRSTVASARKEPNAGPGSHAGPVSGESRSSATTGILRAARLHDDTCGHRGQTLMAVQQLLPPRWTPAPTSSRRRRKPGAGEAARRRPEDHESARRPAGEELRLTGRGEQGSEQGVTAGATTGVTARGQRPPAERR